jgi:phage gp37-like protein
MIGTLENAILERLRGVSDSGALGYALRQIESYAGALDGAALDGAIRTLPAVWVVYAGERGDEAPSRRNPRFQLWVAHQQRRNTGAARLGANPPGATDHSGSYQIVDDLAALIVGQTLGLDIDPFRLVRVASVTQRKDLSVYLIEIETSCLVAALPEDATLADLAEVWVDWDIPGALAAPETLPAAAAAADMQADIRLPIEES